MNVYLGIDIGSISVNTVILDENRNILKNLYTHNQGKPFYVLKRLLEGIIGKYGQENIKTLCFTGSGGKKAAELVGGHFVNEIISQSTATSFLYPEIRTIIELGGEDSKLIFLENNEVSFKTQLSDFSLNNLCAAGTGSFLDQQAKRIGISIDKEFGELALQSEKPPRIAGRCSVFAKSDMIHLQQIATPLHDIVAGLCYAVARNYKSSLGRGKEFAKPISFQGGVAANAGMVRAFKDILNIKGNELIIPEYYASMGAIGAVYHTLESNTQQVPFKGISELEKYLKADNRRKNHLDPLKMPNAEYNKKIISLQGKKEKTEVYLGLDIGSLSTNVVLIDKDHNVVARRYLPTASKPLDAIRRGLKEINEEIGDKVEVKGAGTTGSGRYLSGDFIGADSIQNEITAQATAAIDYDSTVDTIFEIGGQDSKYISIENGVVVDFEMNKVCAAGTGSFLEEQAEKLGVNIKEEFQKEALGSQSPCKLGDRCTVFMESDVNSHQQKGEERQNLLGGLSYSIVYNYIQKVVGNKKIGNKIFFQGGVTNNKSVVAAFEKVTGKSIIVPPHFDVTGAIGAAILAQKAMENKSETRFKGFGVSETPYKIDRFTCKSCSNYCEIRRIKIEGEDKPLFYGGRCEKYEVEERKGKGKGIPNLFEERNQLLKGDFKEKSDPNKPTIGIPKGLMIYYGQFPFWRTFFNELDFNLVISDNTDLQTVTKSMEVLVAETCFPVEVIHGHIDNLLNKGVDYIFMPFIVNVKSEENNPTNNCNCPWIQSYPFMVKSAYKDEEIRKKFLIPTLHFRFFERALTKELSQFINKEFNLPAKKVKKAIAMADQAQLSFEMAVKQRGKEVLENLPKDKEALVVLGRPYNTGDPALNLSLVEKLINLDALPIPVDFLPLEDENIFDEYPMMYWPNGQKILAASKLVAKNKNLNAVYMGNFRCGPDSFILHFVRKEMGEKPFLHLEVDQHSADAGMITRCEAYLDSLRGYKLNQENQQGIDSQKVEALDNNANNHVKKTMYIPYMRDSAYAVAAASRHCGVNAEVLPMQDESDIKLGREHTTGNECFPLICTTGSFLKKLLAPGTVPEKTSFFMPDHNGPCRFGEYNKFQRQLFDELGYKNVEIISPSNENSYSGLFGDKASKFRLLGWKGIVAVDMLRKMKQERRPYEAINGQTNKIYKKWLNAVIESLEQGKKDLAPVLSESAKEFAAIPINNGYRKPVIAIVGEIFMRDNNYCSGNLIERLEDLGAETLMAPMAEWLIYSSYRWKRDSKWKGNTKGVFKSTIQQLAQVASAKKMHKAVEGVAEMNKEVELKEIFDRCDKYIHRDYDGDPPLALGSASALHETQISGVINIMPFTCMPGTLIAAVSGDFRKDHDNIPWENISYDGQDDTNIETRLQAFMHQANQYAEMKGFTKSREWVNQAMIEEQNA